MLPKEKLQRQAAIARSQSQSQKAKNYKQIPNSNATIIGYNADIGQNIIQLPDGSISYAGSDTNGAIALRETVPLHGGTGNIDGLPSIKPLIITEAAKPSFRVTSPFKTLFVKVDPSTGSTILYVGGDRASATKIGEIEQAGGGN